MSVRLCQKFHTACFGQIPEAVDYFGSILLQLLHRNTRNGERAFEFSVRTAYHLCDGADSRQISLLNHTAYPVFGLEIVKIVMVLTNFKKTIPSQTQRLVNLKIKTNVFHILIALISELIFNWIFFVKSVQTCIEFFFLQIFQCFRITLS